MSERLRIVVAGGLAAMPVAGVVWQVLHHLEGFRRLGHDVFYLEDTERWPYDPVNDTVCDNTLPAVRFLSGQLARIGFDERRWAYRDVAGGEVHGCGRDRLARTLAAADLLVNLSAVTVLREEHMAIPARLYLETDPVQPQIEVARGDARTIALLDAHTHHATYGANFGARDCTVPVTRYRYLPTRPPVILDWWAGARPSAPGRAFTTVANFSQRDRDLVWRGRRLTWSKDVEFARVIDLPNRVPAGTTLELALALGSGDDAARLVSRGWSVRPAAPLSRDPDAYRRYIRGSVGEFSVAKEQNVALRSGWFSDRTATYLAAGRPAVIQDTGFGCALPTGTGLLPFASAPEAAAAIAAVVGDYGRHSGAARRIAEERLRAEDVLAELLGRV